METLNDPWPSTELRGARPQAADALRRSEEHRQAPARDRAAPPWKRLCNLSPSVRLRRARPRAADSLRRAEERRGQSARDRATPPWRRSTTPGSQPSSEELDVELPARSSAPKNAFADRRETASRLRERPPATADQTSRPEGHAVQTLRAAGPSRDSSTNPQRASTVRRPPRHPAGLLPSPRTFPQTPLHLYTPRGTSVKEANTSRPCGPVDRPRILQETPKGSSPDTQPASRSMELNSADLSARRAAPKSDTTIQELSHELRGSAYTKRCATVGLRRAFRRREASRSRAQSALPNASVTPHDPEGTIDEPAATARPLRERSAGRAGCLVAPKNLSAGRSRSKRPRVSPSANTESITPTRGPKLMTEVSASRLWMRLHLSLSPWRRLRRAIA